MLLWMARRWSRSGLGRMARSTVRVAALSVFVGTLVMALSLSVVRGFRQAIRHKAALFVGHLVVQKYGPDGGDAPVFWEFAKESHRLRQIPGVRAVNPVLARPAILKTREDLAGVLVKGVDDNFDGGGVFSIPQPGHLSISRTLAEKLGIDSGASVKMYFLSPDSLGGLQLRLPRTYEVAALYYTGMQEFDAYLVLAHKSDLEQIFCPERSGCLSAYEIFCQENKAEAVKLSLNTLFPPEFSILTTRDVLPNLFEWLDYLDVNIFIISLLLMVVGCLSLMAAFYTMVLERRSALGLLRAMGMPSHRLSGVFLLQFSGILAVSMILADGLAWGCVILQSSYALVPLDATNYYLDTVPVVWDWTGVLAVNGMSMVLSFVAMVLPALYLRRFSISQVLRLN
ncbi:MAG: FtsX-like permease family protein [Flavobacteriales bacterium]|nr:FtsX-like permease family protein [Flavobacteriales bacterium]MCX7650545.1 FtsX-like permease family protein [Flavobacteriales bacterium]MDW8431753.1 FtsX-like permease family protein [Flavobacteriales bacterium]